MSGFDMLATLLPRGRAWQTAIERPFVKFLRALSSPLDTLRDHVLAIWLDHFPQTTRQLDSWEAQWWLHSGGLTLQQRRDRLAGVWASVGGQSPAYIQQVLQGAGFPVFVHDWWERMAHGAPCERDSRAYLLPEYGGFDTDGHLIGDLIPRIQRISPVGAGDLVMQAGEILAQAGNFLASKVDHVPVVLPDEFDVRGFAYVGGETFPDVVTIPAARRLEFERLCREHIGTHLWIVLRVVYL